MRIKKHILTDLRTSLRKLSLIKRRKHHPLIHKIHQKHNLSKKTLLYVKEYGPHSNIPKTIIKESLRVLLLTSIVSSAGGFTLESIKALFLSIIPIVILLPVLNGMVGSYGSIISSHFSTIIYKQGLEKVSLKNKELRNLFSKILVISIAISILAALIALVLSISQGFEFSSAIALKIILISLINVIALITLLFFVVIFAGSYFYKKGEDPDNFLIPITTSIADFGNMILLAILVLIFF